MEVDLRSILETISGTNKGSPNLVDSDYEYDQDLEESIDEAKNERPSHLPHDHPGSFFEFIYKMYNLARLLPPVDVLLLVDASSSIGNANYEQVIPDYKKHV